MQTSTHKIEQIYKSAQQLQYEQRLELLERLNSLVYGEVTNLTAIEIIKEFSENSQENYRAIYGKHQVVADTVGQALDALIEEDKVPDESILVVQRFHTDEFFDAAQQKRLRELMARFNDSNDAERLSSDEMNELEKLIEAEYQGAIMRAESILERERK